MEGEEMMLGRSIKAGMGMGIAVVLGALAMPQVQAADDLRLTFTYGNEDFRLTLPVEGDQKETWDSSQRYEVSVWNVDNRMAWGIGALRHEADFSAATYSLSLKTLGARVYYGVVSPLSQALSLDIMAMGGYGRAELEVRQGLVGWKDRGYILEYGAIGQVTFTSNGNSGFLLAAGAGYLLSEGKFDVPTKRSLKQQGLTFHGSIGWRF